MTNRYRDPRESAPLTVVELARVKRWRDDECKEFMTSWLRRWNERNSLLPARLYHYTNVQAVKGMVETQTIWATDARYLNDSTELSYANTVVANVAAELRHQYDAGVQQTYLGAAALDLLNAFTDMFNVYVACFCEKSDLLSQWRGYPPAGGGYAIGFEPDTMRRSTGLQLRRIAYDEDEQATLVREVLGFFADALGGVEAPPALLDYWCRVALHETVHLLSECLFCFKHPTFCEEREWRLVHLVIQREHWPTAPLRFRPGHWSLVPYVELRPNGQPPGDQSGGLPIVEARVGPSAHPDLALSALRKFLAERGHDTPVTTSSVPLRV